MIMKMLITFLYGYMPDDRLHSYRFVIVCSVSSSHMPVKSARKLPNIGTTAKCMDWTSNCIPHFKMGIIIIHIGKLHNVNKMGLK